MKRVFKIASLLMCWSAYADQWGILHTLTGHTGWVRSAVFSPDGSKIVTASDDHTAKIWIDNELFFKALKHRVPRIADQKQYEAALEADMAQKRALLKRYVKGKVDFSTWRDTNGDTILHVLALFFDPQEDRGMVSWFISHYPDLVAVKNNHGETPIMLAAMAGEPMLDIFTRAASIRIKKDLGVRVRSRYQRYWKYLKDAALLGSG